MGRLFNIWARFYDSFLNWVFYSPCGGEKRFRKKCLDFASPVRGEEILDVCCGTGLFTYMIASRTGLDGQVIGVDLSESVLKIARNRTSAFPVKFLIANAASLPFAPSSFDKCFIIFGLHHMPELVRRNTLNEIHRVLKPAGSLFIVEYNLPTRTMAKLMAKVLVKLDESKEAYPMLINQSLFGDIKKAGLNIKRREFIYKGAVHLIEARE